MGKKRFFGAAAGAVLLMAMLLPAGGEQARADAAMQIIQPHAAGQAAGSLYFPLQNAFDSPDTAWDDAAGTVTGGPGAADAPFYSERVGYIDFGPDWAGIRITSAWTKYRAWSTGDQTPYEELWWDDDIDDVNDSGFTETRINFNSAQGLSTGGTTPWVLDSDVSSNPVAPKARYLLLRSPAGMTNRATEYAIVGYVDVTPVAAITVTGEGGADTITEPQGTLQMHAQISPANATIKKVQWTVENGTGSATISGSGLLTAVSDGTVTVRATAMDGSGVSGALVVTISNQGSGGNGGDGGGGSEPLQIIVPFAAGQALGSPYFPLQNAFDGQPQFDDYTGQPQGGAGASDAPAYSGRVGYIDFGPDWNKVNIVSVWTQYRPSSVGDQTPYEELWWDDDTDTVNDSGLAETGINFNTAQGLSTGSSTPWVKDREFADPVKPKARYLMLRSPEGMTNRAKEYAIIGWIDANGNGVQDVPFTPVSEIVVSAEGGSSSVLVNETLQMSAELYPYIASNKSYVWSVENGTGSAVIDANGLLTALSEGTVTVKATAQDGSNVTGSLVIEISKYRSFILPVEGQPAFSYTDIQAAFPEVDWQTLERLYIPAGTYEYARLQNLPQRTPENPLIITNYGGQVKIGGKHSYVLSLGGGSHWILTGEYNEELKTGHPDYIGHANGNYANSQGNYGIEITRSKESGIMVGGFATNFELSFIEVGFAGFAGLLIKTDNQPAATMDGVKIHDMYIHDSESEGMYIGNTQAIDAQHTFTNLQIYNNRILRSGTEGLQLTNMGDGLKVYNNVIALCALRWKDPFQQWQDGCFQYSQRSGSAEIHHNVFIGGASKIFEFWMTAASDEETNPNDVVWIHDNYFSHSRNLFSYIHNVPANPDTKLLFENNIIRQVNFHYDELPGGRPNPNVLVNVIHNQNNPMTFKNNVRDGTQVFIDTIGGDNGTAGNVTAFGNTTVASLAPIEFVDVTFPANFDWNLIEVWAEDSALYGGPIYYSEGDYVYYWPTGELYVCIEPGIHTGKNPKTHPSTWQLVSPMKDDFRTSPASPYQGIGLMD